MKTALIAGALALTISTAAVAAPCSPRSLLGTWTAQATVTSTLDSTARFATCEWLVRRKLGERGKLSVVSTCSDQFLQPLPRETYTLARPYDPAPRCRWELSDPSGLYSHLEFSPDSRQFVGAGGITFGHHFGATSAVSGFKR